MELNKINLQEISNGNIQLLDKYVKNGGDINVKIPVVKINRLLIGRHNLDSNTFFYSFKLY